jgi:hypothetical protein
MRLDALIIIPVRHTPTLFAPHLDIVHHTTLRLHHTTGWYCACQRPCSCFRQWYAVVFDISC